MVPHIFFLLEFFVCKHAQILTPGDCTITVYDILGNLKYVLRFQLERHAFSFFGVSFLWWNMESGTDGMNRGSVSYEPQFCGAQGL